MTVPPSASFLSSLTSVSGILTTPSLSLSADRDVEARPRRRDPGSSRTITSTSARAACSAPPRPGAGSARSRARPGRSQRELGSPGGAVRRSASAPRRTRLDPALGRPEGGRDPAGVPPSTSSTLPAGAASGEPRSRRASRRATSTEPTPSTAALMGLGRERPAVSAEPSTRHTSQSGRVRSRRAVELARPLDQAPPRPGFGQAHTRDMGGGSKPVPSAPLRPLESPRYGSSESRWR